MATKAKEVIEETAKNMFGETVKQSWIIILVVIAMIVLVLVVVYIVSMVKKNKLQNVVLQPNMIVMDNRSMVPYSVPAGNMSLVSNGQEFSYSFWIYMGSSFNTTGQPKIILQRGNITTYAGSTIQISSGTNPIVLLDPTSNTMYFAVATSAVPATSMTPSQIIQRDPATGQFTSGYLVTYIDYIPLQRWVNIALVVKDTSLFVYMDADLYSVVTIADVTNSRNTKPMLSGTSGNLTIGDNVHYTPGYMSLTRFYNYAIGQTDIQGMYNNGPVEATWLSYLGLGNYGVRSPVYEVA